MGVAETILEPACAQQPCFRLQYYNRFVLLLSWEGRLLTVLQRRGTGQDQPAENDLPFSRPESDESIVSTAALTHTAALVWRK